MAEVLLEHATLRHVHLVAPRLRKADREEITASSGLRPAQILRGSLRRSAWARAALIENEVAALFGIVDLGRMAHPWLVTTVTVDRYPLTFWRASKIVLREIRTLYPVLVQSIDSRYTQALSWARRLGFVIGPAQPFGASALPFHPVVLRS